MPPHRCRRCGTRPLTTRASRASWWPARAAPSRSPASSSGTSAPSWTTQPLGPAPPTSRLVLCYCCAVLLLCFAIAVLCCVGEVGGRGSWHRELFRRSCYGRLARQAAPVLLPPAGLLSPGSPREGLSVLPAAPAALSHAVPCCDVPAAGRVPAAERARGDGGGHICAAQPRGAAAAHPGHSQGRERGWGGRWWRMAGSSL